MVVGVSVVSSGQTVMHRGSAGSSQIRSEQKIFLSFSQPHVLQPSKYSQHERSTPRTVVVGHSNGCGVVVVEVMVLVTVVSVRVVVMVVAVVVVMDVCVRVVSVAVVAVAVVVVVVEVD